MQPTFILYIILFLFHPTQSKPVPINPFAAETSGKEALSSTSYALLPEQKSITESIIPETRIESPGQLKITCLTIGSRGDVQPYIALCKGLQEANHVCTIATHPEFKNWIESHGIRFVSIGGSPVELIKHCTENGVLSPGFWVKGLAKFGEWYQDLLKQSYTALEDQHVLIESPSAMVGTHVAEALQIPYYRAFTMPWTQTSQYPHAFAPQSLRHIPFYNSMSYKVFDFGVWLGIKKHVNIWRKEKGLQGLSYLALRKRKYPFLYNFSPSVVEKPKDWDSSVSITGYWFLNDKPNPVADEPEKVGLPVDLKEFIGKARLEGKKIVYIGFGSIVVEDPTKMTQTIVDAVKDADVYAVVSAGWSGRGTEGTDQVVEQRKQFTDKMFHVDSVPHDLLFSEIDAAVHHGGAGSTGASLRGILLPRLNFYLARARRVEELGVGTSLKKLDSDQLAKALKTATQDPDQIERARAIGAQIRQEDGVANAIQAIYRHYGETRTMVRQYALESETFDKQTSVWERLVNKMATMAMFIITFAPRMIYRGAHIVTKPKLIR
ncbi:hypothetical protein CROQUDRAFT_64424 [Cronartium quercuum f. sp. fusiforme G11]|uniref:sterol 3beta-glucosyltransferase n=1 Tax=Cronartium quercuum f. sp. fusiforme G11 TaxID=708437 RepID=A0A9P6TBT8_9BASI|nr:hypothetical protein CROQUDRAFT_64424 [Cronartium quercuum f. sp. fusiforme G11]